jgi:dCMP deaminase
MPIRFKDLVPENTHPLNLIEVPEGEAPSAHLPDRPPLFEVYMRMAEDLAKRSTCRRLSVGTVITDPTLENVVAIGYNGNVRGFPNDCDSPTPGSCGCIHSEMNALVKAPGGMRDKVAFVTASPCVMCAKLMVQAQVSHLFYRVAYRKPEGLEILRRAGVTVVRYDRWRSAWRDFPGDPESDANGIQDHQRQQQGLIGQ